MGRLSKKKFKELVSFLFGNLAITPKKHPLSYEFLRQASVLHSSGIPNEFLIAWLKQKNHFTDAQLILFMGDILRELKNHSLNRYDEKKSEFSFHQFLQNVLMSNEDNEVHAKAWLKILSEDAHVKKYNPTHQNSVRPFQRILPHAIKIIDHI